MLSCLLDDVRVVQYLHSSGTQALHSLLSCEITTMWACTAIGVLQDETFQKALHPVMQVDGAHVQEAAAAGMAAAAAGRQAQRGGLHQMGSVVGN